MTRDATPKTAERRARLADRIGLGPAITLFLATGVLWFLTTRPVEGLRALQPGTQLPIDHWSIVFSAIFGGIVFVAGLIGIAILVFSVVASDRRPRTSD